MGNAGTAGKSMGCEGRGKRIAIVTFGCQMNVRDSEVIAGLLTQESYKLVSNEKDADIIIYNTCSVRQHAEDKVWSELGKFSKQKNLNHKPIIGLVGCMAQNYKEDVFKRTTNVDFVVGPSDIHNIPEIINRFSQERFSRANICQTEGQNRSEEIYRTGFYEDKQHAYVVISEGCSNACSYCIVPYVRGPLKNRNYKDIIDEIKQAVDKGITSFTLLGQNVNAYCYGGVDFIRLLALVESINGLKQLSFITSHPKDTKIDLFKAMRDSKKIKQYLHLPVQSGSDRILKLMKRGYTRKFYLDLIQAYRKILQNAVLSTDIMVSFPSETENEFKDSYNLVKEVEFDSAYIFKYSIRPHTQAERLPDDIPLKEKQRRHQFILDLQKSISRRKRQNV